MGLLVDKMRADPAWAKIADEGDEGTIKEWLTKRTIPVYDITNVARYLRDSSLGGLEDLSAFPNVAPPHRLYWMEFANPGKTFELVRNAKYPDRIGVCLWQSEPPEDGVWEVSCHAWGEWNGRAEPLCSWYLRFVQDGFPEVISTHVYKDISRLFDGRPAITDEQAEEASKEFEGKSLAELRLLAEKARLDLAKADASLDDSWAGWVKLSVLYPALMAHSLMSCKNVVQETHTPPAALNKKHQRKFGAPLVRFTTLRVVPVGGKNHESGSGNGFDKSLHIVRGHFKSYTSDRPLFGRLSGTYWWSPGLRGDAKRGVVVKNYQIDAPQRTGTDG